VQTSFDHDSSPARRGAWVQSQLLCMAVPPGHPNTPAPTTSGRVRAETTAAQPGCAACHEFFDPVGLGLERFDQLGRYRTVYSTREPIDDLGTFPDGRTFHGPGGLGDLLVADPAFRRCVAQKAMMYALGRHLDDDDVAAVERVASAFERNGLTVRALLASVVADDAFRMRRGEGAP
jgi:hypothetical protein